MDYKENRLSIIIEDIISEGQIDIKSLSKKLKVSTMTIYRDIEEFTKRGVIKKEKGILSSSQIFTLEYFHDVRAKLNIQSKIKVAEEAVKIIQPNNKGSVGNAISKSKKVSPKSDSEIDNGVKVTMI